MLIQWIRNCKWMKIQPFLHSLYTNCEFPSLAFPHRQNKDELLLSAASRWRRRQYIVHRVIHCRLSHVCDLAREEREFVALAWLAGGRRKEREKVSATAADDDDDVEMRFHMGLQVEAVQGSGLLFSSAVHYVGSVPLLLILTISTPSKLCIPFIFLC